MEREGMVRWNENHNRSWKQRLCDPREQFYSGSESQSANAIWP